jgi:hypothetical protein
VRDVEYHVVSSTPVEVAARRLAAPVTRWLPAAGGLRGTHECDGFLAVLGLRVAARFLADDVWQAEACTTRAVRVKLGRGGGIMPVCILEGELTVAPTASVTDVCFRGSGRSSRAGPRRAALAWLISGPAARALTRAVALRLANDAALGQGVSCDD